jgi:hypothetical protein
MNTIALNSHTIYCPKPFKLIFKLYSHILSTLLLSHYFPIFWLFFIIQIYDYILIIIVKKHNKFKFIHYFFTNMLLLSLIIIESIKHM